MKIILSMVMFLSLSLASPAMITGSDIQLEVRQGGTTVFDVTNAISSPSPSVEFTLPAGTFTDPVTIINADISSIPPSGPSQSVLQGTIDIEFLTTYSVAAGSPLRFVFRDVGVATHNFTSLTLNSSPAITNGSTATISGPNSLVLVISRTLGGAANPLIINPGTFSLGFTTVPEPGSIGLMGLCFAAAVFVRRKMKV